MTSSKSIALFGLSLLLTFGFLIAGIGPSNSKGAENPTPINFCNSPNQTECVESLEYLNKDSKELGFETFTFFKIGANGEVVFDTSGTSFATSNDSVKKYISLTASRMNLYGENLLVPGYQNALPNTGVAGGPGLITVSEIDLIGFYLMLGENNGPQSEYQLADRKRIGDRFRLKMRIGKLKPHAFETVTSNFDFKVLEGSDFNYLVAEGDVSAYYNIRSGNEPCGDTSIASARQHGWMTDIFSAKSQTNQVLVPYKAKKLSECIVRLPSFSPDGLVNFSMSAPHFEPDGITPVVGDIEIQMPLSYWPALGLEGSENVNVSYGGPFVPISANRTVFDGEVKYQIPNVHFSTPQFAIGKAKTYSTGNVLGKQQSMSKGSKQAITSVAINSGMNVPAKSKISATVSKSSRKICKTQGSKLVALKAGACTVAVTVKAPKPAPVTTAGSVTSGKGTLSSAQVAAQTGINVPAKSKVSFTIDRASRKVCSASGTKLRFKTAGTCSFKMKVQAPQPGPVKQTSTITVN